MLSDLSKIIKSAAELSWERIAILAVFLVILLGGYYGYRRISALDFQADQATQQVTPEDNFIQQFGKKYLNIDANIHNYLTELRFKTNADWVLFFGIHNGQNIGPYHLKKVSIIDESIRRANTPLYDKIQNIPMTLFSSTYPSFLETDTVIVRSADRAPEGSMSELIRNGINFEISTGIYLETYQSPIGFIGVFYRKSTVKQLKNDPDKIEKFKKYLLETKGLIEYELNRSYQLNSNE